MSRCASEAASASVVPNPVLRDLGRACDFATIHRQMVEFTRQRDSTTPDEYWYLTHAPVFTQGLNGRPEHVLDPGGIPVVPTDRGGQVTYHGPGQLVLYTLVDLARRGIGVREWVSRLEQSIIDVLATFGVSAERLSGAPGVYVSGAKIAALGLKVRQGRCYHGLSFNIDMDLAPFARINPCGMARLPVTQLRDVCAEGATASALSIEGIARQLVELLSAPGD
ncbi:octanoyltransferase [Halothiobacillus diazotrophicus]|uniref:Octanoyltransferase n=1 Tax=Halothiobacillus diazotrophicus TaxID=1860122 RepID=A0A191ZGI0_9GAMM|nr:lipoyl(octanoyl) transferase LipB [Halothiobacillus diazotrophicus]ANJ66989.1 octanoyltransferase [Halothiobacillus diazotrophicus]